MIGISGGRRACFAHNSSTFGRTVTSAFILNYFMGEIVLTMRKLLKYLRNNYQLYLFLVPALIYLAVFQYAPLYGVQIAFRDYTPKLGIFGSPWVGLAHFRTFFGSFYFKELLVNTLALSGLTLLFGFPLPIILALLLNQLPGKRYRKLVQTVTYAPYFISTVVICGMLYVFLSPSSGLVNHIIVAFGGKPVNFMGEAKYFRGIYVISEIWQMTGWNTIIYLAALSGVSPELHEAAVMDGAGKLQRIWHIDIPGILPQAMILLILNVGSIMSIGFEKAFLLQNDVNAVNSEIISTYVYKMGIQQAQHSFASAVGLFNSVINMILLLIINWLSGKLTENSLW